MRKGDKVKTRSGNIETVSRVEKARVFTYENLCDWYHPTKIFPVTEKE